MKRIPSNSQILKEWNNGCKGKVTFKELEYGKKKLEYFCQKHQKPFRLYLCPTRKPIGFSRWDEWWLLNY